MIVEILLTKLYSLLDTPVYLDPVVMDSLDLIITTTVIINRQTWCIVLYRQTCRIVLYRQTCRIVLYFNCHHEEMCRGDTLTTRSESACLTRAHAYLVQTMK